MKIAPIFILPLLSLSALANFDLGTNASVCPYDRYMGPVKSVLSQLNGNPVSFERVRELMKQGRSFRYSFDTPYVPNTPAVTSARKAGDCKDKALWLAKEIGDPSVRFVIGKARKESKISHAWLYWKDSNSRWWVLDCSNLRAPVAADSVPANQYIPYYSYSRTGIFCHPAAAVWNERKPLAVTNR